MTLIQKYNFSMILVVAFLLCNMIVKGQNNGKTFTFNQISETDFRKAFNNNVNAIPVQINDSAKIEKALKKIDKIYNQQEIDLANNELCKSPRCLTEFKGYYPNLGTLVFFIQNYHYENAVFLKDDEDILSIPLVGRFNGSYGIMSKTGLWVGLEREDCDNYLQIEICKITKNGAWSIIKFDFKSIDINEEEKHPIFWVNENTIYLATIEYTNAENRVQVKYYEIKFSY